MQRRIIGRTQNRTRYAANETYEERETHTGEKKKNNASDCRRPSEIVVYCREFHAIRDGQIVRQ